jgi:hypothetical protein
MSQYDNPNQEVVRPLEDATPTEPEPQPAPSPEPEPEPDEVNES